MKCGPRFARFRCGRRPLPDSDHGWCQPGGPSGRFRYGLPRPWRDRWRDGYGGRWFGPGWGQARRRRVAGESRGAGYGCARLQARRAADPSLANARAHGRCRSVERGPENLLAIIHGLPSSRGWAPVSDCRVTRSRKVRGDRITTDPYRGSVKSRLLPVIRTAPPAVAVAR